MNRRRIEDLLTSAGLNDSTADELSRLLTPFASDAQGNIQAQVAMRTGTLSSLRQLAGANGEISVATNVPAAVLHNGVAGQARTLMHPWGVQIVEATLSTTGRPVPANGVGWSVVNLTKTLDTHGVLNATTGVFNIPVSVVSQYAWITFAAEVNFEERVGNGTFRRLVLGSLDTIVSALAGDGAVSGYRRFKVANEPLSWSPTADTGNLPLVAVQNQTATCNLDLRLEVWGVPA